MADPIAIGIITVIHSRGDCDLAARSYRGLSDPALTEPMRRTIDPKKRICRIGGARRNHPRTHRR
jgi:hypothetical protein